MLARPGTTDGPMISPTPRTCTRAGQTHRTPTRDVGPGRRPEVDIDRPGARPGATKHRSAIRWTAARPAMEENYTRPHMAAQTKEMRKGRDGDEEAAD